MTEAEKQAQIDEMWHDYVNEGWWLLYSYYHRAYRCEPWPPGAREEVLRLKAEAEADPRGYSVTRPRLKPEPR